MKIAIIGYAGVGKTTLSNMLNITNHKVIHVDEVVNGLYATENIISNHIKDKFPECIIWGNIDKNLLGDILLNDKKSREELEDLLYKEIFFPMTCGEPDVIVDGITPRFAYYFDMVLFAHVNKQERKRRLLKRGVSAKRIKQIMKVQKNWYTYFK